MVLAVLQKTVCFTSSCLVNIVPGSNKVLKFYVGPFYN